MPIVLVSCAVAGNLARVNRGDDASNVVSPCGSPALAVPAALASLPTSVRRLPAVLESASGDRQGTVYFDIYDLLCPFSPRMMPTVKIDRRGRIDQRVVDVARVNLVPQVGRRVAPWARQLDERPNTLSWRAPGPGSTSSAG